MATRTFSAKDENLEEILAAIKSQQDDEANGKWDISLFYIEFTPIVSRAILQAFRHCSRNGINFGRLTIE